MQTADPTTALTGLGAAEVAERIRRGEVNRAPRSNWADYRAIAARNLLTLFNALVVPAAIALFLLGDYRAAWAVSGMAVINTVIGLVQEIRAKRHLDRLAILGEARARVLRDGKEVTIPAGEVVLDDCLLLAAGEPVVADGTILAARFLEIDEALLTGESDPVPRHPGERLLSGSFCVAGEGAYRAERVGAAAFAQQTSAQARRYDFTAGPLHRTIDLLIRILTAIAVLLCVLYLGLYFTRGFSLDDLALMVAATVTSMVPQGLVLMTTLALTLSAVRLGLRGAIVQRLAAVEAMASVEVLCLDKTGTLTTSRLSLDRLRPLNGAEEQTVRNLLRLFAWASVDERSKSIQALREGLGPLPADPPMQLLDQIPFKSQNRYSAVQVRWGADEHALVLGAVEALRPFIETAEAAGVEGAWRELLPTGLRLLLFAEVSEGSHPSPTPSPKRRGEPEGSSPLSVSGRGQGEGFFLSLDGVRLRPLALVALSDELRPDVGSVLEGLAEQGIACKILSGDNPETVRATVAHLHLPLAPHVVSGDQLDSAADRDEIIAQQSVFGRVTPQQKLEIVRTLQARGVSVGMIGDGVNDVLTIKRADLGIAMGEGSTAARSVAGVVLETNQFDLLPMALEESRTVLNNVRRAAKLFLLKNVYTLFLIVAALGILGLPFPYRPQQVTLLNALTIGGPAFLIMFGRRRPGAPALPHESTAHFLREVGWFAIGTGLVIGAAGLAIFDLASRWQADEQTQRTLLLSVLILLGLASVLRLLLERDGRGSTTDRWLFAWIALAVPVYIAVLYIPPLAYFFELTPLSLGQWVVVAIIAVSAFLVSAVQGRRTLERGGP
jgi:cation-transporting ATPase E